MLTREEKRRLRLAACAGGLGREIAILRIKFMDILAVDNIHPFILNESAGTLARLYKINFSYSRRDIAYLKEAVASVLEDFIRNTLTIL
jgi:hypothetical protein